VVLSPAAAAPGAAIRFSSDTFYVDEGQRLAVIRVERSGPLAVGRSLVDYATTARSSTSTATPGSDYIETSGTIAFEVGEMAKSFTVVIRDDTEPEAAEEVLLTLSNPRGDTSDVGPPAVLVILDNDSAAARKPLVSDPAVATPTASSGADTTIAPRRQQTPIRRMVPTRGTRGPRAPTPFELRSPARPVAPATSRPSTVEPILVVLAGVMLAHVAARLWFRSRVPDPDG
jgi:hypothetical protein